MPQIPPSADTIASKFHDLLRRVASTTRISIDRQGRYHCAPDGRNNRRYAEVEGTVFTGGHGHTIAAPPWVAYRGVRCPVCLGAAVI